MVVLINCKRKRLWGNMAIEEGARYIPNRAFCDRVRTLKSMHATVPPTRRCERGQNVPVNRVKTSCPFADVCSLFIKGVGCTYGRPELRKPKEAIKREDLNGILNLVCPDTP
jgi:hypothetical protein